MRAGVNRDVHSPARLLVVQLTIDDEDRVSDERYRRMDGEVDRRLRLAGVEDASPAARGVDDDDDTPPAPASGMQLQC